MMSQPCDSSPVRFRTRTGGGSILHCEVWLPANRDQVFGFFADAFELERITPAWLRFQVRTPKPIQIGRGTLIDYRLRLHGIPLSWRSEISVWEPPLRFVDQQVRGPYRLWRHEHTFVTVRGGTLVRDQVEYRTPGGRWIDWFWVRRDLRRIFEFRRQELLRIFDPQRLRHRLTL